MNAYKISELKPGEYTSSVNLSSNKTTELRDLVFQKIKDTLPLDTWLVDIEVSVLCHVRRTPGEPAPFDMELHTYHSEG